jgi:hypothetical protein
MQEIFLQGHILSTLGDDALGRTMKAPYELCGWALLRPVWRLQEPCCCCICKQGNTIFVFFQKTSGELQTNARGCTAAQWLMRSRKEGWAGLGWAFTQSRVCYRGVVFSSSNPWKSNSLVPIQNDDPTSWAFDPRVV